MKKRSKLPDLPKDQKVKCNTIIHMASVAAGGVGTGLAQLPLADNAVITPIQVTMIVSLGKVFGQKVTETAAKAIISGAAASIVGRGISQVLFGWIPGLGNAVNTATAAGITEAIGWMAVDHFRRLPSGNTASQATYETETDSEDEESDDFSILYDRADEFLSGKKNLKEHSKEYNTLLSDIEDALLSLPEDHHLSSVYDSLADLQINASYSSDDAKA